MSRGWIGFDLDGTLAEYTEWRSWRSIGAPVPAMIAILKQHLAAGDPCRIFTARAYVANGREQCRTTGEWFTTGDMVLVIEDWLRTHVGTLLPVTCLKDYHMLKLYDDRAVAVEANTGRCAFFQDGNYHILNGGPDA